MANESGGGNGALYFMVGGLVVVVGIGAFIYTGGHLGSHAGGTTTEQTTTTSPAPAGSTTTTTRTEKTTH
jgi:hypothetical protein